VSRTTQSVVLLLVGASVAVMLARGTYLNYVKPSLMPWLVAAAVVLVLLGLAAVIGELREIGKAAGHHDDGHRHNASLGWLLLIPIAMVAFVVPPALDAGGVTATPATIAPPPRAFPPLPAGAAPTVPVPEVVMRAAADPAKSLDGRTITVSGFTLHYPDGLYVGRVVIVCCAADAQLARIRLAGPGAGTAAGFDENTWVQLRGQIEPGSAQPSNHFVPTMNVAAATRIDKPPNTYAY
jgi:uncharacterized repeat protein (TIGR03943 family)